LAGLTYGLIEGPAQGWTSDSVLAALLVALLTGPALILLERSRPDPMLPLSMFRTRQFSAANAVTFVVYAALGGVLFLLPVELQVVSGYSPAHAGLSLLPVTVLMLAFSARSGRLASRIGPRLQMSVGPVVVGAGLLLLTRATDGASYPDFVLPAVLVFGAGLAMTVAPLTATAMGAAPPEHAGTASAVNNVVARAAGLIAVAVLPFAAGLSGASALHPPAFADGFRAAVTIAGVVCAIGGLLAWALIRNPGPTEAPRDGPARRYHCAVDGSPIQPSLGN
jgi:predicted MFS family arabinose efflux permease